jgi:hypothetical protein
VHRSMGTALFRRIDRITLIEIASVDLFITVISLLFLYLYRTAEKKREGNNSAR